MLINVLIHNLNYFPLLWESTQVNCIGSVHWSTLPTNKYNFHITDTGIIWIPIPQYVDVATPHHRIPTYPPTHSPHSNRNFLIDSKLYWPLIYIQMHLSSSLVTTNYFKHMAVAILNFKYFYVEIYFMITYDSWGRSGSKSLSHNKSNS